MVLPFPKASLPNSTLRWQVPNSVPASLAKGHPPSQGWLENYHRPPEISGATPRPEVDVTLPPTLLPPEEELQNVESLRRREISSPQTHQKTRLHLLEAEVDANPQAFHVEDALQRKVATCQEKRTDWKCTLQKTLVSNSPNQAKADKK